MLDLKGVLCVGWKGVGGMREQAINHMMACQAKSCQARRKKVNYQPSCVCLSVRVLPNCCPALRVSFIPQHDTPSKK